jgi:hypothetical protein
VIVLLVTWRICLSLQEIEEIDEDRERAEEEAEREEEESLRAETAAPVARST